MPRARDELFDSDVELLVGVMRVRSNGAIDQWKALRNRKHIAMAFDPRGDSNDSFYAGRLRARDGGRYARIRRE